MRERLRSLDGASAVEFALVLPILVVLIFGIFFAGLGLNLQLVSNHAARDAARFAATLPFVDDGSGDMDRTWFVDVRDRAVEAGEGHYGTLSGGSFTGASGAVICVAYNDGSVWRRYTWTASAESTADGANAFCFDDELTDERVQVGLARDAAYNMIFLPPRTITLEGDAVARFEDQQP